MILILIIVVHWISISEFWSLQNIDLQHHWSLLISQHFLIDLTFLQPTDYWLITKHQSLIFPLDFFQNPDSDVQWLISLISDQWSHQSMIRDFYHRLMITPHLNLILGFWSLSVDFWSLAVIFYNNLIFDFHLDTCSLIWSLLFGLWCFKLLSVRRASSCPAQRSLKTDNFFEYFENVGASFGGASFIPKLFFANNFV